MSEKLPVLKAMDVIAELQNSEHGLVDLEGVKINLSTPEGVDLAPSVWRQLEALGESIKEQAAETNKAGQTFVNMAKRLKELVKASMIQDESRELVGNTTRICLERPTSKLVIEGEVPAKYYVERVVREVDEEALKQDLEMGVAIPGARLEKSFSIRPRPNTKGKVA